MRILCIFHLLINFSQQILARSFINPFIISAESVKDGEFPFIVAIEINGGTICSGTLVREDLVLTSNTCLAGNNFTFSIIAGVSDLSNKQNPKRQVRYSDEIIPYEDSAAVSGFNVSLVQLQSSFVLTDTVKPINLTKQIPAEVSSGIIPGWGSNFLLDYFGNVPGLHKTQQIPILDHKTCEKKFPGTPEFGIPKFEPKINFCAGNPASGPCPVDAGGPFLVGKDNDILYGIYEWGERDGVFFNLCAINGNGGRYIRILPLLPWLKQKVNEIPPPSQSTTEKESVTTTSSPPEQTSSLAPPEPKDLSQNKLILIILVVFSTLTCIIHVAIFVILIIRRYLASKQTSFGKILIKRQKTCQDNFL